MAWHGVGETYLRRPESTPAEASHFHRLAATTHHELGDAWHEALAREGLAEALHAAGSPEEARAEWAEAARLVAGFDDARARGVRERVERRLESND
jgi:hypothetical protein